MIGLDAKLLFLYFFMKRTYKNPSATNTKPLNRKADTMIFQLEDNYYLKKSGMDQKDLPIPAVSPSKA